jgi:hypothetical protein
MATAVAVAILISALPDNSWQPPSLARRQVTLFPLVDADARMASALPAWPLLAR